MDGSSPIRTPGSGDSRLPQGRGEYQRGRGAIGDDRWRRWLPDRTLDPLAELRLLCLPYAGGDATGYRRWPDLVPDRIQVCPIELPGRGRRMSEAPFQRLSPLARRLAESLGPVIDRPFAIFGHSMGGLVAFELTRALRALGAPAPEHLFISGAAAPGERAALPSLRCAPDLELKRELRALNGTPQAVLDSDELMAMLLPVVRADFSVLETYEYRAEPPLDVPLTVFGGVSDPVVPVSAILPWQRESARHSRLQLFAGDHFFVDSCVGDVVKAVVRALDPVTATHSSDREHPIRP